MKGLEYFEVECQEEKGGAIYREIAEDILGDLDLLKTISKLHIFIDLNVPLFLAVGITKKLPRLVRVRDFTNILEQEGKVTLDISDETYLSQLLSILWEKFGRNLVEQPDRWTVVITGEHARRDDIEDIVVYDPSEGMHKDLIYALQYIAPEGFKVRRQYVKDNLFYYVASENTLPESVIDHLITDKFAVIGVKM